MHEVAVDLADDRFDVRFERGRVDEQSIVRTVRELGYEPELVTAVASTPAETERVDPRALPPELEATFARARASGQPVLLDFFAPD